jgi:hypothetical protein
MESNLFTDIKDSLADGITDVKKPVSKVLDTLEKWFPADSSSQE